MSRFIKIREDRINVDHIIEYYPDKSDDNRIYIQLLDGIKTYLLPTKSERDKVISTLDETLGCIILYMDEEKE